MRALVLAALLGGCQADPPVEPAAQVEIAPVETSPIEAPALQETCIDLDGLLARRAHLPGASLATRWGELADPDHRGEDGEARPVRSAVIASLSQPDGRQTLLVQCVVLHEAGGLGVRSAQHLVEVTADGAVRPRVAQLGQQECCGLTWWTGPTLRISTLVPGAVELVGAYESSGDYQSVTSPSATLLLGPAQDPPAEPGPACETEGLVPLARTDRLLLAGDAVVAHPTQWLLRSTTRAKGGQISLTERWTPVNQPGLPGGWDESLPAGPRGKPVTLRRSVRWDRALGRFVEPCPSAPRPDVWSDW